MRTTFNTFNINIHTHTHRTQDTNIAKNSQNRSNLFQIVVFCNLLIMTKSTQHNLMSPIEILKGTHRNQVKSNQFAGKSPGFSSPHLHCGLSFYDMCVSALRQMIMHEYQTTEIRAL